MKAVLQRVSEASVRVGEDEVGSIGTGLVVMVGVEEGDGRREVTELVDRILRYRIFPDENGRMNRDLHEIAGDLMLVPNFTLCADTGASGNRPGFGPAAPPDRAERLFDHMLDHARNNAPAAVASGSFGAMMDVTLVNDGPVTFVLEP